MQLPDHLSRQGDWIIECDKALVIQVDQWTESTVSGSGGGGLMVNGYGGTNSVNVSTRHDRFIRLWVRYENGEEAEINLKNQDIGIRAGHNVLLFWRKKEGSGNLKLFAIYNTATRMLNNPEAGNIPNFLIGMALIILGGLVIWLTWNPWAVVVSQIVAVAGYFLWRHAGTKEGNRMAEEIIHHLDRQRTAEPALVADGVIVSEGNS